MITIDASIGGSNNGFHPIIKAIDIQILSLYRLHPGRQIPIG